MNYPSANQTNYFRYALYDTMPITDGSLELFTEPMGIKGKTRADTNMTLPGQLPAFQSMLIQHINIYVMGENPINGSPSRSKAGKAIYTNGPSALIINNMIVQESPNIMYLSPIFTILPVEFNIYLTHKDAFRYMMYFKDAHKLKGIHIRVALTGMITRNSQ